MTPGLVEHPHRLDFEASPIFSVEIDNQVPVPLHRHSFYEVAIVMNGTAQHQSENTVFAVSPLDVFIVPTGATHRWVSTRNLNILNIYYSPAHFTLPVESIGPASLYSMLFFSSEFFEGQGMNPVVHFRIQEATLARVIKEFEDAAIFRKVNDAVASTDSKDKLLESVYFENSQRLFNQGAFLKVIASLTVDYLKSRSLSVPGKKLHPAVYRLAELLDQAAIAGSAPEIHRQAEQLGISSEYLTRLFTEGIGISPVKFFNKRRLNYAKRLLLDGSMSITQIAQRFGFSDAAHFSNSFREHVGVAPSEFRTAYHGMR
ncbi:DNA-binding domain-containing protein, AraC-type [Opitutaceae bacterium TAV1]|nr:DNA-binding domain-containing protein, AraC-type [Opitutaceae bacterium TAV1]